jgi:hypothetical protein
MDRFGPRSTPIRAAPAIFEGTWSAAITEPAMMPTGKLFIRLHASARTRPVPHVALLEDSATVTSSRPSLCLRRSSFPGNGIARPETTWPKTARCPSSVSLRDRNADGGARFGGIQQQPGNLIYRVTAWWAREDSNLKPERYELSARLDARPLNWGCAQEPWPYGCQWRAHPVKRIIIRGLRPA